MKNLCIVEFPSNLGLKEPQPGKEPGVKKLPEWLRKHHFHDTINPERILGLDPPKYCNVKDSETGILNAHSLIKYATDQAILINLLLSDAKFPFVIGGDCSILIGSAIALKRRGDFALFYLDGHTDFMDISLSQTGGAGGMAASIVTGNGHKNMTDIQNLKPYIKENNLWCVGNREYDEAYENEIRKTKATYFSLESLRGKGIENCAEAFLTEINDKALDGFWLHIDVDVLNDTLMPCVDSRTPDGLSYLEFNKLTGTLFKSDKLKGLEITILDPELDPSGSYTHDFVSNFAKTFNDAKSW